MNKWNLERAETIRRFIDKYFMENHKSPTVRDIAAGTGISKTAVQRYLTDMKEQGEIEYSGRRSIGTNLSRNMFETTPAIRYNSTVGWSLHSTTKKAQKQSHSPKLMKFSVRIYRYSLYQRKKTTIGCLFLLVCVIEQDIQVKEYAQHILLRIRPQGRILGRSIDPCYPYQTAEIRTLCRWATGSDFSLFLMILMSYQKMIYNK